MWASLLCLGLMTIGGALADNQGDRHQQQQQQSLVWYHHRVVPPSSESIIGGGGGDSSASVRVSRSATTTNNNNNNKPLRVKSDSPREQRRRCRVKGTCRGRNWCPDVDVGNRAYLAPTVFEGKARSMTSLRKPGSNYAVTFEVKQVYKNQPGFQPLLKNDSVRLHFRDKAPAGKSTVCDSSGNSNNSNNNNNNNREAKFASTSSFKESGGGAVRANIKRGKVYLVFVNRVGHRNFTILGEPVIRSKKNEQAVQAVVRPDYGEFFFII